MKRFLSLLLAFVLSLALTIPVFAAGSGNHDDEIMPLAQLCTICHGNMVTRYEWDKTPIKVESVSCAHYPYGDDIIYTYQGMKYTTCVNCKRGPSAEVTRTETKCFGHYA